MKRNNEIKFKKVIVDMDNRFKSITQYLFVIVLVVILSVAGGSHFSIIGVAGNVEETANEDMGHFQLNNESIEKVMIVSTVEQLPRFMSNTVFSIEVENIPEEIEQSEETTVETEVSEINTDEKVGPGFVESEPEEVSEEIVEVVEAEPEFTYLLDLTSEERAILERITEAEVTGDERSFRNVTRQEVYESKIRVAQVVIERVRSTKFPNTVEGVVFQKRQFSPIGDKRYWKVEVCDLTREAVEAALRSDTPQYSQGALFFTRGKSCGAKASPLFTDPVGHTFFK